MSTTSENDKKKDDENSDKIKYVVLLCLPHHTLCGGLSDRLRPLPFYLMVAHYTKRILCIYWEKPFGLEEFLQPIPEIGIDWRCPYHVREAYYLQDNNHKNSQQKEKMLLENENPNVGLYPFGYCKKNTIPYASCVEEDIIKLRDSQHMYATLDLYTHSNDCINTANLLAQRHSYGGETNIASDSNNNETFMMPEIKHWQYPEMIADIFRVMFEPVPELARRINDTMTQLDLVENEFVTSHVRARYPAGFIVKYMNGNRKQAFDKDGGLKFEGQLRSWMENIVQNAVICGHLLAPDLKVFFVSDHNDAMNMALTGKIKAKGETEAIRGVGVVRKDEPLHMDGNNNQKSNVTDFYSVFEDLLIMGGSRCVAHGIGSFGSFGAGLTGNKCRAIHRKFNAVTVQCPNDRAERVGIAIDAKEMMFGEKPSEYKKIKFES